MAQQTIQLPASVYFGLSSTVAWNYTNNRPRINNNLTDGTTVYLDSARVNSNGRVELAFALAASGDIGGDQSLSADFESSGGFDITVGAFSLSVNLEGADTTDPYQWTPSNSAEAIQFYNDVFALTGNQSATLVLRDFEPAAPDTPAAPTVTALSTSSIQAVGVAPDAQPDIDTYDWRYRIVGNSTWIDRLDETNLTQTFHGA